MDVSDPEFHRIALQNSRRMTAGYRRLLDEAVAARELVRCDTARLARAVGAISGGSLIGWAILRAGPAERYVRTDLMTLLAPYKRAKTAGRSARSGRSRPTPRSA